MLLGNRTPTREARIRFTEVKDAPLATAEAGASNDLSHAGALIRSIESRPEFRTLGEDTILGRERAAAVALTLSRLLTVIHIGVQSLRMSKPIEPQ